MVFKVNLTLHLSPPSLGGEIIDRSFHLPNATAFTSPASPPPVVPSTPDPGAVDFSLILQSTSTIPGGWSNVEQFAQSLVTQLRPSARGNHVGVVNFADSPNTQLKFNSLPEGDITASNINTRISGIRPGGQFNMINSGLKEADQQLFTSVGGMRQGVRKVWPRPKPTL